MKTFKEWSKLSNKEISPKDRIYLLNENVKPIQHSIVHDEVRKAFEDFVKLAPEGGWAIIGGIALGAYTVSRATTDIDMVVQNSSEITILEQALKSKFKKIRPSCFEHKDTGVEIEIITPELINASPEFIKSVLDNSRTDIVNGKRIQIADPKHLIALKLGRGIKTDKGSIAKARMDQSNILQLISLYGKMDLTDLNLPKEEIELYNKLCAELGK